MSNWIPTPAQISKETIAVILGAFIGITLIHLLPDKFQKYFILNQGTL